MSIFRQYDIRGIYGKDLEESLACGIGKAFGTQVLRSGGRKIALGYDVRLSTPVLREAFLSGLLSTGLNVTDIGACPTPVLYFALFQLEVDGGAMITASHNPAEFNGFKLSIGTQSLFGAGIQALKSMIDRGDFIEGKGHLSFEEDFLSRYADYFLMEFKPFSKLKVVVDCGNGAAALNAPDVFKRLGCDLIPLFCEPDGRFPNHHPDPTEARNLETLIETVRREKADLGIAFDGDADRLGAVDECGKIIWGDRLTLLFAADILKTHPGATIISEVKASQLLYDEVARLGGEAIMWKTGHSLIKAKMKESGALLAGEMSGHLFFADRYFGYDDAIYAACRLMEILIKGKIPLSGHFKGLHERCATPEIRVDCPDAQKFELVENCRVRLAQTHQTIDIDGVRVLFDQGWGLIRASNTQPALVLRFEAETPEALATYQDYIQKVLQQAGA